MAGTTEPLDLRMQSIVLFENLIRFGKAKLKFNQECQKHWSPLCGLTGLLF